ncbi:MULTISPECIES: cobyrinate a,c-diamide synthase [Rhodomicrobium]|uniref:cobyrinate a,c-diamide synthase n=1 Tax=Rhodomicrobium TaxID=1068 RepID=UPI000B4AD2DC|nr:MULTISPECIES: cobyrinate a,c-diamide synthase [Rhodomicrobium]
MSAPGIVIAAAGSGAGKTTLALGLMRALRNRGLRVRGFKSGPDYIDPAFHAVATGQESFNLDSFAMGSDLLDAIAGHGAAGRDIVVAEGAMGLFDGVRAPLGRRGAAADLALRYGWPVLLVIDCRAVAQTAAAIAAGLAHFDKRIRIAGVVLNNVASARHRASVEDGFSGLAIPVLGALARNADFALPERHLGLVQAGEIGGLETRLEGFAAAVETGCDVPAIAARAGGARIAGGGAIAGIPAPGRCIAIAKDAAFSFIYPHVLAGWRMSGAEIVYFSPLADEPPPEDCDACFLPGGYPELHAGVLAGAQRFMRELRAFAETRPIHGECGGYMVLGRSLTDADGIAHEMAGLLPVATSFQARRLTLGYRRAEFGGRALMGHEFHYATMLTPPPADTEAYAAVYDGEGESLGLAGHRSGNVSGSFFHAVAPAVMAGPDAV